MRKRNDTQLHIACTSQEVKAFRQLADAAHLPLSTFIKQTLHKLVDETKKEQAA